MTNFEKFTPESLAELLAESLWCCKGCPIEYNCSSGTSCERNLLKWLNSEVNDDG